jgi:myo-inositol-1(or 4)-monophosphatase
MITNPDTAGLLQSVIAAAEDAGRLLAAEFIRPGGPRGRGSHADVDDEMEALLRERLLRLLPARWLGEETGALVGPGGSWCWLVDPHDGTSAFLAGERGSAVSIALLREAIPVLGVVHAPFPPDRGADTIAWADGSDCLLRNQPR